MGPLQQVIDIIKVQRLRESGVFILSEFRERLAELLLDLGDDFPFSLLAAEVILKDLMLPLCELLSVVTRLCGARAGA
jgi:hypothetical protein